MSPDGYEADHGPVSAEHLAKSLAQALKPVHAALRAPMPAQLCPQAKSTPIPLWKSVVGAFFSLKGPWGRLLMSELRGGATAA